MAKVHVIESSTWQIGILPETGASSAFGRVRYQDQWRDVMRPTPREKYDSSSACASFLLVPWSNRIRDGRFRFRGNEYQLRVNSDDGTAIHGVGRKLPWKVESATTSSIVCTFDSADFPDINWPWQFSSRAEFSVAGRDFTMVLSIKNEASAPFPAGFGHHPYFQRTFAGPQDTVLLQVPCSRSFPLDKALPTGGPIPIAPRIDFQQMRPLGDDFIDDVLTGRTYSEPIRFRYTRSDLALEMHADPLFETVIVYAPVGKDFFAVEPVTNANDGFNLDDQGIPGSGVFVLEPGQECAGTVTLSVV